MKLLVKKGTTSKLVYVFVNNSSVSTGAGLTGLVYNTASLTAYYNREGAAGAATAISLASPTKGTWTSGGFIAVDGTNTPGLYELGLPDAALATGTNSVVVMLKGATNMAPVLLEIQLVDFDPADATALGLSKFADIETDTQNIQSRLPTALTGGKMDSDAQAIGSTAVDSIWAKAMSDLAAVPSATASVLAAINWLFTLGRNKRTQTATTETVFKDNSSTPVATSTKSDDGTTFTRGKLT